MRPTFLPFVLLSLAAAPTGAAAQLVPDLPLSLEARGGIAIPTGDFTEEAPGVGAESGPAFSAGAMLHFTPGLALYGAYSRSTFRCELCTEPGFDIEEDVVSDGFSAGIHTAAPFGIAGVRPWIRAGGLYHDLTFSGFDSEFSSEPAFGFEVGGGLSIELLPTLALTPGVHYRAYSAEFDLGGIAENTIDVTHLTVDVGISYDLSR